MVVQISVIIPVFNAVNYLAEAVESALQQEETAEICLVEDGSTDNSLQLARQLVQQYAPRVRLFCFPDGQNHGPAAARNLGIRHAKYKFIAFLDADDFYLTHRFTATRQLFEQQPNCQAVYAPMGVFLSDTAALELHRAHSQGLKRVDFHPSQPAVFFEEYLLGERGYISLNTVVLKKELIERVGGFDESLRHGEDTDLVLRLAQAGEWQRTADREVVCLMRIHAQRSVYDTSKMYAGRILFFQKWQRWSVVHACDLEVRLFLLRRTIALEFAAYCDRTSSKRPRRYIRYLFKLGRLVHYTWQSVLVRWRHTKRWC